MKWTIKLKTLLGTIMTVTAIASSPSEAKSLAELMASDENNGMLGARVVSVKL